ncbi:molybdopterin binding oxidoreductase small and medium subunit, fused [Vulcanisaeta moutnovskia 768-28]|uniref:Molybdopterin binding oxidoreductase small and medium subunit, fused n=1 Tax=Vulcanisaeta moutnovskia (strain 768-28) TaxID=985053 RepID=F0QY92_VULM7|nr:FAD binding domain-containing protein [Vulcanisaeta moutnovskia]ADY01329.1 molybdopterin binding oxidoreductase small and medium subunit, fused [Vulcanisaeta moutnovskia 768-28]
MGMAYALGIPRGFKYLRVSTIDEALSLLNEYDGDAKVLAGGMSLMPMLKLRMTEVKYLIDILGINELRYVRVEGNYLRIGALTTHGDVAMNKLVNEHAKILSESAWHIADIQVRNLGTIGGSIAHADPAANYYPALIALDAEVVIRGVGTERTIKVSDLYKGPYITDLKQNEVITEVRIPLSGLRGVYEFFRRGGASFPSVIVTVTYQERDGIITDSRIAIGAVYPEPVLVSGHLNGLGIKEVGARVSDIVNSIFSSIDAKPLEDTHAPSDYKVRVARNLLTKALMSIANGSMQYLKTPTREDLIRWEFRDGVEYVGELVKVRVNVNGQWIEDLVEPRLLLLDFLRRHGFKEVRRGCDEGKCGACTVLVDGRAVKSCMVPVIRVSGHSVTTIRGLSKGMELHPIQRAFLEEYAMQCGFCTHGFMMVTHDYLTNIDPAADEDVMKLSIKNICRCTGYVNIIRAIKRASKYLTGGT